MKKDEWEQHRQVAGNLWRAQQDRHERLLSGFNKATVRRTTTVEYNTAYNTATILKRDAEESEKKERKREEKEEKKRVSEGKRCATEAKKRLRAEEAEVRTCRVSGCLGVWMQRKGGGWMWCDQCGVYGVCEMHWEAGVRGEGQVTMRSHEGDCGRPKKRCRRTPSK